MSPLFFMSRKNLFETPVWLFEPAIEIKNSLPGLQSSLDSLRQQSLKAHSHKSIRNGWRMDDIHLLPQFKLLSDYMQWLLKQVMLDLSADLSQQYGFSSWLNVHDEGGFNTVHHHGTSALSGVFYARCPSGSGTLHLRDPRPGAYFGKQLIAAGKDFAIEPREGHAVIFPGFLEHWVSPSSSSDRISVAFNLNLQ